MKKTTLHVCIIVAVLSFGQASNAQHYNQTAKEMYSDGQYFLNRGDYEEAVYYFLRLLESDSTNANLNFKVGTCFLNIPGKEQRAIKYLEKAAIDITAEYDKKSINEQQAPLHAIYYLGNAYRMNNEIDKALEVYNKFISSPYFEGNYNITVVENEMAATERAKTIIDNAINIKLIKFDSLVNTSSDEFRPLLSGDGNHLVFVRSLKFYDAVMYTHKKNGAWINPIVLNPYIKSDGNHYPTGISYYGDIIYFVEDRDFNKDLYSSKFENGEWKPLEEFDKHINSNGSETYASVSTDGQQLIFSSDRWGGEGGLDLYIAKKDKKGNWEKPQNLGPKINSENDETAAFFTNNNKTIVFSSNGHFKMGGYDVFYANLIDGEWSAPVNMGYPINTTTNNVHYQPLNSGYSLLFSQFTEKGENEDVYLAHILSPLNLVDSQDTAFDKKSAIHLAEKNTIYLIEPTSSDTTLIMEIDKKSNSVELFKKDSGIQVEVK